MSKVALVRPQVIIVHPNGTRTRGTVIGHEISHQSTNGISGGLLSRVMTIELGEEIKPKKPKPRCMTRYGITAYACMRKNGHKGLHRNGRLRWGLKR